MMITSTKQINKITNDDNDDDVYYLY